MNWIPLQSVEGIEEVIKNSFAIPCLIFKHSIYCPVSSLVKYRLENAWRVDLAALDLYYLDLISFRKVSNTIASLFAIRHESPQILLIQEGECIFHASHLDINSSDVQKKLVLP